MKKGKKLKCRDCGKKGKFKISIWQFKHWDGYRVCKKCGDKRAVQSLDCLLGM